MTRPWGQPLSAVLLVLATSVALLGAADIHDRHREPARPPAPLAARAVEAAAPAPRQAWTPHDDLLVTDPVHHPHGISDRLVRLTDATPSGAQIEVTSYDLESARVVAALVAAHRRGVGVRVITDRARTAGSAVLAPLVKALGYWADNGPRARSWVHFVVGSSRGPGGAVHQKSYLFSRVGDARWVSVVGSYNTSDVADARAYALMHQVVGRGVYAAFARVFALQALDRDWAEPLRTASGRGWSAYFLPVGDDSPAEDPVVRRLADLPRGPGTVVRVAMFSMWDTRGEWVAQRIAGLARSGARVVFVAGPTVSAAVIAILEAGGVEVRSGCYADGTFTHSKDMTASFVRDGRRERWTWIGSDNWTTNGTHSDEAVLGIRSDRTYRLFGRAFRDLLHREDAVPTTRCDPIE